MVQHEHLKIIEKLSQCDSDLTTFTSTQQIEHILSSHAGWTTFTTQQRIACFLREEVKRRSVVVDGVMKGTKHVQELFQPFQQLSSEEESVYGITARFGMQLSPKSPASGMFGIMKYTLTYDSMQNDILLHELAIGLVLNKLRSYIPTFMYTYAGLVCSPPAHLKGKMASSKLKKLLIPLVTSPEWDPLFGSEDEFVEEYTPPYPSYALQAFDSEFLQDKKNKKHSIVSKFLDLCTNQLFDTSSTDSVEALDKMLEKLTKLKQKMQDLKPSQMGKKKDTDVILKSMNNTLHKFEALLSDSKKRTELKALFDIIKSDKGLYKPFEPSELCASNEYSSTLLLAELIPNAVPLSTLSLSGSETFDHVYLQLFLSLYVAYKKYKFHHNDLHLNNVLVRRLSSPVTITYSNEALGGARNKYVSFSTYLIPQIIDFGRSTLDVPTIHEKTTTIISLRSADYDDVVSKLIDVDNEDVFLLLDGLQDRLKGCSSTFQNILKPFVKELAASNPEEAQERKKRLGGRAPHYLDLIAEKLIETYGKDTVFINIP
jgi:hypothetical protein